MLLARPLSVDQRDRRGSHTSSWINGFELDGTSRDRCCCSFLYYISSASREAGIEGRLLVPAVRFLVIIIWFWFQKLTQVVGFGGDWWYKAQEIIFFTFDSFCQDSLLRCWQHQRYQQCALKIYQRRKAFIWRIWILWMSILWQPPHDHAENNPRWTRMRRAMMSRPLSV